MTALNKILTNLGYTDDAIQILDSVHESVAVTLLTYLSPNHSLQQFYLLFCAYKEYFSTCGISELVLMNHTDLSIEHMRLIYRGIREGFDVTFYNSPAFSLSQVKIIYSGLEKGLDVSGFAKEDLSVDEMVKIYIELYRKTYIGSKITQELLMTKWKI